MGELLPDELTGDALAELTRLAREASKRFARHQYLEAMASLSAMEPLKTLLVEQCSHRWAGVDDEPIDEPPHLTYGYV